VALWESVTRHSGATVLDFREVPSVGYGWMENPSLIFKEHSYLSFSSHPRKEIKALPTAEKNSPRRVKAD
jgi:hypothetical protein